MSLLTKIWTFFMSGIQCKRVERFQMSFFEFMAYDSFKAASIRINNGENVRLPGLYVVNLYCRGMPCSHFIVGVS